MPRKRPSEEECKLPKKKPCYKDKEAELVNAESFHIEQFYQALKQGNEVKKTQYKFLLFLDACHRELNGEFDIHAFDAVKSGLLSIMRNELYKSIHFSVASSFLNFVRGELIEKKDLNFDKKISSFLSEVCADSCISAIDREQFYRFFCDSNTPSFGFVKDVTGGFMVGAHSAEELCVFTAQTLAGEYFPLEDTSVV